MTFQAHHFIFLHHGFDFVFVHCSNGMLLSQLFTLMQILLLWKVSRIFSSVASFVETWSILKEWILVWWLLNPLKLFSMIWWTKWVNCLLTLEVSALLFLFSMFHFFVNIIPLWEGHSTSSHYSLLFSLFWKTYWLRLMISSFLSASKYNSTCLRTYDMMLIVTRHILWSIGNS